MNHLQWYYNGALPPPILLPLLLPLYNSDCGLSVIFQGSLNFKYNILLTFYHKIKFIKALLHLQYSIHTPCTHSIHTPCTRSIHTPCTHSIHTHSTHSIHTPCTPCTHPTLKQNIQALAEKSKKILPIYSLKLMLETKFCMSMATKLSIIE